MTSTSGLWWREFVRSAEPDIDILATPEFLAENFTDFFGQFLQQDGNADLASLNELLMKFYNNPNYKFSIYSVADGAFIPHPEPKNPDSWFDPHIRFIAPVQPSDTSNPWTIFIVGSNDLHASDRFLQVVSWDTTKKEYRFYGREEVQPLHPQSAEPTAWIYQGRSSNAFHEATSYLGPFNGHVNGALVMKELEKPWYHWESAQESNFNQCFSDAERASFMNAPYISSDNNLFSNVGDANQLQITIQNGVTKWYTQRSKNDFPEPSGGAASSTRVIQRWMSHVLLTTTVNITVAAVNPDMPDKAWFAPADHFINNMMLKLSSFSDLLPDYPKLAFTDENYQKAVDELGLYLIQENMTGQAIPGYENFVAAAGVLGGGKETGEHEQLCFVAVKRGEGLPFVVLQPSYEDAQGAQKMQSISSTVSMLSEATFNALMMIDICNPIYSWRRGVLMQYVPTTTAWNSKTGYDLEENFIKAVEASKYANDETMPEYQFLQLRNVQTNVHRNNISRYLTLVASRLSTPEGLVEYMTLAESRRRIFRPLPLDEFGYTLPYALKYVPTKPLEMTMAGTTQEMPERGINFIESWTSTLWGDNPQLIPVGPSFVRTKRASPKGPCAADLPLRHIPCEGPRRFKRTSGCPFASKVRSGSTVVRC